MKKPEVISGASGHRVALNADQHLAESKRVVRQPVRPDAAASVRSQRLLAEPALKNSSLKPISKQSGEAVQADLEARIRQLSRVTEHLRAELDTLDRSSAGKG